jgi:hypothetical protein
MSGEQLRALLSYNNKEESGDSWDITDSEEFVHGYTTMDNGDIKDFFKTIDLSCRAIVNYNGDER